MNERETFKSQCRFSHLKTMNIQELGRSRSGTGLWKLVRER